MWGVASDIVSTTSGSVELRTGDQVQYAVYERDVDHPRLTLNPDGTLEVVTNNNTPTYSLVMSNVGWITNEYIDQLKQVSAITAEYGNLTNRFTLWGKSYELIETVGTYDIEINDDTAVVTSPAGRKCRPYLANQLRFALKSAIRSISNDFCDLLDVDYRSLAIRNQRTKWASCSTGSILSFNIRCAFLPISHLQYLVAHEVAHLVHPEHSPEFWDTVELLVPGYETYRSQLQGFWYTIHRNSLWCDLLDM